MNKGICRSEPLLAKAFAARTTVYFCRSEPPLANPSVAGAASYRS